MEMNKKRYWLRGGLIGLGIFLLIIFIAQILIYNILTTILPFDNTAISFCGAYSFICSIRYFLLALVANLDILGILACKGFCVGEEGMVQILSMPISYTLYGIIIGYIYGKIKERKK